jgi:hypothetical protein
MPQKQRSEAGFFYKTSQASRKTMKAQNLLFKSLSGNLRQTGRIELL